MQLSFLDLQQNTRMLRVKDKQINLNELHDSFLKKLKTKKE